MFNEITVCGVQCSNCPEFEKACSGCNNLQGKVFWTSHINMETCPIYNCCVNEKHYEHCGTCQQLPCKIYFDTRDPSMTIAEHNIGVQRRVNALKSRI